MLPTPSSSSASLAPAAPQQGLLPSGAWTSDGAAASRHQLAISNGVLLAAVIFLFMVVVFVFLLYLYAKRYLGTSNPLLAPSTPSSRFLFVAASPLPQRGLPAAVLRSLPSRSTAPPAPPAPPALGGPGAEPRREERAEHGRGAGERGRTLLPCSFLPRRGARPRPGAGRRPPSWAGGLRAAAARGRIKPHGRHAVSSSLPAAARGPSLPHPRRAVGSGRARGARRPPAPI